MYWARKYNLTTVFYVSILEIGLSFYVVIVLATQRTSHSQSKGKTFISQYLVDPVSIPRGRNRDTLALQSSALLTELVLLLCFRLSTSKREFSRRTPEIYRRACFLPSWSKVHFLWDRRFYWGWFTLVITILTYMTRIKVHSNFLKIDILTLFWLVLTVSDVISSALIQPRH